MDARHGRELACRRALLPCVSDAPACGSASEAAAARHGLTAERLAGRIAEQRCQGVAPGCTGGGSPGVASACIALPGCGDGSLTGLAAAGIARSALGGAGALHRQCGDGRRESAFDDFELASARTRSGRFRQACRRKVGSARVGSGTASTGATCDGRWRRHRRAAAARSSGSAGGAASGSTGAARQRVPMRRRRCAGRAAPAKRCDGCGVALRMRRGRSASIAIGGRMTSGIRTGGTRSIVGRSRARHRRHRAHREAQIVHHRHAVGRAAQARGRRSRRR